MFVIAQTRADRKITVCDQLSEAVLICTERHIAATPRLPSPLLDYQTKASLRRASTTQSHKLLRELFKKMATLQ